MVPRSPFIAIAAICMVSFAAAQDQAPSKERYVHAVTRGAGLMPWQDPGVSHAETEFRSDIEARKDAMLAGRTLVHHPVLLDQAALDRARRNMATTDWAKAWFDSHKARADYLVSRPKGYVEAMIPELTPTNTYGATCPNCVGTKSQEGVGSSLFGWDYKRPDEIRCTRCDQVYPDPWFPETATLVAPRTGQTFTFYLNETEQRNPEDRTGRHAWHWVGHPIHVSFSGYIRGRKTRFMISGLNSLAYAYALTGDPAYADTGKRIFVRLASCYRNWLYYDYWDTIADCDPMYAAWHDRALPIEWKRHLCESVYAKDSVENACMLQTYWGAGRLGASTDSVSAAAAVCEAYDLMCDARNADGKPVWRPEERTVVERDLVLEWVMGAEPYLGGAGKADCVNNKAPRIYRSLAAVARCLGIPDYADVALRGYEGLRDQSFLYDGFSHESPAYTNMYLASLIWVPETLHGFQWPEGYAGRYGAVDLYGTDTGLRLMYRSIPDQLDPNGYYLPLSDTRVQNHPSPSIIEVGMKRYPEFFAGLHPAARGAGHPSSYAVFHLDAEVFEPTDRPDAPEILYPAWMTAILRHGTGGQSVLAMPFNPPGGHRHYDNLALYYQAFGKPVLGDLGYVGDMPVNGWIHATVSHNLVVVDDAGQLFREDTPRVPKLERMATSPEVSLIEASSQCYPQCSRYRRMAVLVKGPVGQTFVVDIFRVTGGKKHAYRVFSAVASSDEPDGSIVFTGLDMPDEPPLPQIGQSLRREDIHGLRDVRRAEDPPAMWQVVWRQADRQHRLWMASSVDVVEASNGPGQTTRGNAGRRVRYLDAIRTGDGLGSTFVAVHEPSDADGQLPIRAVERLDVPAPAGPDAVAVRIDSAWGVYHLFHEFEAPADVDGIRFHGAFGLVKQQEGQTQWLFSIGANTFEQGVLGYADQPAHWAGNVTGSTAAALVPGTPRPEPWPEAPPGFWNYLVVHTATHWTGFPIVGTSPDRIEIGRFPLPSDITEFQVEALRFLDFTE